MNPVLLSSERMDWETPQDLFDRLHRYYGFDLDVCATHLNAKCGEFISPEQDGLMRSWGRRTCWMNPPYGRELPKWIDKAIAESRKGADVVALVPARPDTRWFRRAFAAARELYFVAGRLTFGGAGAPAPFPSAVLVITATGGPPEVRYLNAKGEGI
jgi:phage N-6-adenine-methyltransferase